MKQTLEQVVLVFLCYKQAKYLPKTLRSAIEQTVYPAELLIMDDASPDESETVINDILDEADPNLKITYKRNEKNIGLMAQLNTLANLYCDKLIVVQAGDDVSKPNRLERIHEEWVRSGYPSLVLSNSDEIDEEGRVVRKFDAKSVKKQKPYTFDRLIRRRAEVFGCSAAIDCRILHDFPPIPRNVINEDRITSFRALLRNGIRYIHEPLLDYRVGVGISARSEENYLDYVVREAERELVDLEVNRNDAMRENRKDLVKKIDRRVRLIRWASELREAPTLANCWWYVFKGVPFFQMLKFIKRIKKRTRQ